MAVKCYIEEYDAGDDVLGVRLREKETGRRVEITAFTREEHDAFVMFLASPRMTGTAEALENLYEIDGFDDFVLVDGNVEEDTTDFVRFTYDSALTYLIG